VPTLDTVSVNPKIVPAR